MQKENKAQTVRQNIAINKITKNYKIKKITKFQFNYTQKMRFSK